MVHETVVHIRITCAPNKKTATTAPVNTKSHPGSVFSFTISPSRHLPTKSECI